MSSESWRSVSSCAGIEVSSSGMVRSVPHVDHRGRPWPGRVLKPYLTGKAPGYMTVSIGRKNLKVHRLVCEAFHGPRLDLHVNHKDGNPHNNASDNLEWCTPSENTRHGYASNGRKSCGGHRGKLGQLHHSAKSVYAFPPGSMTPRIFGSTAEAARHIGASAGAVPRACAGKQATAKGWACAYTVPA